MMKNKLTIDFNGEDLKKKIDETSGFLTLSGVLARTGIQDYYGFELSDELEPMKKYSVFRPKEEVLHKESLATFVNATVTDDHPSEAVTVDNIKVLDKGSLSNISTFEKNGENFISGKTTIKDKDLIKKIQNGKVELSVGYTNDLKEGSGKDYDFMQTNIRVNHIAVVDKGRCGGECKLSLDNRVKILHSYTKTEEEMKKIVIGGDTFDVPEKVKLSYDELAQENSGLKEGKKADEKKLNELKKSKEDVTTSKDDEISQAKKEIEALKAKIDTLKASKMSTDSINALVAEKAQVVAFASSFIGDVDMTQDTQALKIAAVSKYMGDGFTADGKTPEYINASYDIIVAGKKEVNDSLPSGGSQTPQVTRDSATQAYHKQILGEK